MTVGRLLEPKTLVPVGMITGVLISWPLWVSMREYPPVPLFGLPPLAPPFDLILVFQLLAACAWLIYARDARHPTAIAAVAYLALVTFDQSRLQPWAVLDIFLMLAIGFLPIPTGAIRFMLVGTYFWSGVQKLNFTYAHEVFPWLVEPVRAFMTLPPNENLALLAMSTALAEAAIAFALLVPKLRHLALLGGIFMHTGLFLLLGPSGHDWNPVVWPWNLLMMGLLYHVTTEQHPKNTVRELVTSKQPLAYLLLIWFGLLPLLQTKGLWDSYLSSALYTGSTRDGALIVRAERLDRWPASARAVARPLSDGRWSVPFLTWSMEALQVPAYPEIRIYRAVAAQMCKLDDTLTLRIGGRPDLFSGKRQQTDVTCTE